MPVDPDDMLDEDLDAEPSLLLIGWHISEVVSAAEALGQPAIACAARRLGLEVGRAMAREVTRQASTDVAH